MSQARADLSRAAAAVPPHAWFAVSAVFHYLGPSLAVLLFASVGVIGTAWLRIAAAATFFALAGRPWRAFARTDPRTRWLIVGLGATLAVMNSSFYLALDRMPMSLVAAMEFVGTIAVALWGLRSPRNLAALALAVGGVVILIDIRWSSDPVGLFWATVNGVLFVCYIVIGHRIAESGAGDGIARLGAAMMVAFLVVMPLGLVEAARALAMPHLVLAALGVGICSSVVPYICDQLAMARLPRASFALMLALLPAVATVIAAIVLGQIPGPRDLLGIALVMAGVGLHRPAEAGR